MSPREHEASGGSENQKILTIALAVLIVTACAVGYAPRTTAATYTGGFLFRGTLEAWLNILYALIVAQIAALVWLQKRCSNTRQLDIWLRADSGADEQVRTLLERAHVLLLKGGPVKPMTDAILQLHACGKALANLQSKRSTMFLCWASATLGMVVTVVFRLSKLSEVYVSWALVAALGLFVVECWAGLPLFLRIITHAPRDLPERLDDVKFAPTVRQRTYWTGRAERREAWWPEIAVVIDESRTVPARPRNYSVNGQGCSVACREPIDPYASVQVAMNGRSLPAIVTHCTPHGQIYHYGIEFDESDWPFAAAEFAKNN